MEKLKHIATEVQFVNENGTHFKVLFWGKHGNLDYRLYVNGEIVLGGNLEFGHANKTAAINIINQFITKNN